MGFSIILLLFFSFQSRSFFLSVGLGAYNISVVIGKVILLFHEYLHLSVQISPEGISSRDEKVFRFASIRNIPLVMLTSGEPNSGLFFVSFLVRKV